MIFPKQYQPEKSQPKYREGFSRVFSSVAVDLFLETGLMLQHQQHPPFYLNPTLLLTAACVTLCGPIRRVSSCSREACCELLSTPMLL